MCIALHLILMNLHAFAHIFVHLQSRKCILLYFFPLFTLNYAYRITWILDCLWQPSQIPLASPHLVSRENLRMNVGLSQASTTRSHSVGIFRCDTSYILIAQRLQWRKVPPLTATTRQFKYMLCHSRRTPLCVIRLALPVHWWDCINGY